MSSTSSKVIVDLPQDCRNQAVEFQKERLSARPVPSHFRGVDAAELDAETYKWAQSLATDPYLTNQVILVTGGASGIGREIAGFCAEAGAHVLVLDAAKGVKEQYEQDDHITGFHLDITNQDDVREVIGEIGAKVGIQKLVSVAGIFPERPVIGEPIPDSAALAMNVNALGANNVMNAAIPFLVDPENKPLHPGMLTLLTKNTLHPSHSTYAASKSAEQSFVKFYENQLDGYLKALAEKSGRPRTDYCLPLSLSFRPDNVTNTPLWGATPEARKIALTESAAKRGQSYEEFMANPNPIGSISTSWVIAGHVVRAMHPAADLAHGSVIELNGGTMTLQG